MAYGSNGGFTHSDLYTMPVELRRFYAKKFIDVKKKEQELSKGTNSPSPGRIFKPGVNPKTVPNVRK